MKNYRLPLCIINALALYYARRELSRDYYHKEGGIGPHAENLRLRPANPNGFEKEKCLENLFAACRRTGWGCTAMAGTFEFYKIHRKTVFMTGENFPIGTLSIKDIVG